ncbi:hypothetical protein [Singulisphaera sp. PoT]|uniref:hypothetical protein n=1 Tax=Singulisphaera sp. PoT TaxID=3411797 RepID=UPI003BF4DAF0
MTREQGLQAWPSIRPTRFDASNSVPVLIQVPTIGSGPHRAPSSPHRGKVRRTTRRRRLRREVRWTAYTLLATTPLTLAFLLFGGAPPAVSMASSPSPKVPVVASAAPECDGCSEMHRPPSISITIEPAPAATPAIVDVEAPVVFPGYLLPDDEREENPHAGS